MARPMLLYGGGLRLFAALRLRVKDLDFERGEITVGEGKGDKDRLTTKPRAVVHRVQFNLQHWTSTIRATVRFLGKSLTLAASVWPMARIAEQDVQA